MKRVKLSNQAEIVIGEDEVRTVLEGITKKDQIVALKNGVFNSSYFVAIVDDNDDKRNQKEGTLHDGLLVIRYFGSWYVDGEFDGEGKPTKRIDSAYYPEVARDCVPTRKEFEEIYRELPREKRLELICAGTREPKSGGLNKIGELLSGATKRLLK